MVGAATPWQWDLNAGLELPESSEGSRLYLASDVELHVQPMSLNNGFKFYFSRNINDTDDPRSPHRIFRRRRSERSPYIKTERRSSSRDHSATRTACTTLK